MNEKMFDWLNKKMKPIIQHRWFNKITAVIVLLNPIAFIPQVYNVSLGHTEGLSVGMFSLFAVLQITFTLMAVQLRDGRIFWANVLALLQVIYIIIILI